MDQTPIVRARTTTRELNFNRENALYLILNIIGHDVIHDYSSPNERWKQNIDYIKAFYSEYTISVPTPTDTLIELVNDVKKIQQSIKEFNQIIWTQNEFDYGGGGEKYVGTLVFETADNGISKQITVEQVFVPFSKNSLFDKTAFKQEYMILSDDILDDKKYQTFKTAIIGDIIGNNV